MIPIEDSLTSDPVQAMFCGPIPRMQQALAALAASGLKDIPCFARNIAVRDLSIVDVLNQGCSKGTRWSDGPVTAASLANRSWPLVTITTT